MIRRFFTDTRAKVIGDAEQRTVAHRISTPMLDRQNDVVEPLGTIDRAALERVASGPPWEMRA